MGGAGKVVTVYNRETEELIEEFAGSSDVKSVSIWENESGQGCIVAGFEDGTIKVWDAGVSALTPTPISFKSEHPPLLVAASLELKAEKQNAHAQHQYGESIRAVQFSPDGSTIVSCGVDKTIKVWDAGTIAHCIPHPAQS